MGHRTNLAAQVGVRGRILLEEQFQTIEIGKRCLSPKEATIKFSVRGELVEP